MRRCSFVNHRRCVLASAPPPFGYPQVYKLFLDSHAKATSKQSITRFFKPAVAVAGIDAAADTAAASGRRRK